MPCDHAGCQLPDINTAVEPHYTLADGKKLHVTCYVESIQG